MPALVWFGLLSLDSGGGGLSCLREGRGGRGFVLPVLHGATDGAGGCSCVGGAQGRDGVVLRPGWFHSCVGAGRPGGRACTDSPVPRPAAIRDRGLRGDGGEVRG